jgi:hypothetical protein
MRHFEYTPRHTRLDLGRFVKNLADDVDDDGLKKLAEEFGEVQSAVIMTVSEGWV